VNGSNTIGITNAKLFEATIDRHAAIKKQRPHRPVATNEAFLEFRQQIHLRVRLLPGPPRVN
jgi:hypothetical protein